MSYHLNFLGLLPYWKQYLDGALLTLALTIFSTMFGLLIGTLCAVARRSANSSWQRVSAIYVEIIRNTPFIVQIFILYFGLSSMGLKLSGFIAAGIAMVVNVGAYSGEIIRAGMDATPLGEIEAAECLGLSKVRIYLNVIITPALEKIYPALTSQFILMMLMSSVASQISVEELTAVGNNVQAETFLSFESYVLVAALYLLLAFILKIVFTALGYLFFKKKRAIAKMNRRLQVAANRGSV